VKTTRRNKMNNTIKKIAEQILFLDTLDVRKSDRLDFSEQSVWQIKEALEAAYQAGKNDAATDPK